AGGGAVHSITSGHRAPRTLPSSTERLGPQRASRVAHAYGEATDVKLGGFSAPTQDMSGAFGSARNDTTTSCAQGDAGETKCPMPGMLMMVALSRLAAAALAPARDVSVSKLPEMRRVGMPLPTGR